MPISPAANRRACNSLRRKRANTSLPATERLGFSEIMEIRARYFFHKIRRMLASLSVVGILRQQSLTDSGNLMAHGILAGLAHERP